MAAICGYGCADAAKLSSDERAMLAPYALPQSAPPDSSNAVADDPRAATLGHRIFFDVRFSGPLKAPNDGVTDGSLGMIGATGKVSCVKCHQLDVQGGGSDHRSRAQTSLGATYTGRNAPTIINAALWDVAYGGWQAWDGHKDSPWSLALDALEGAPHNVTRLAIAHTIYDDAVYMQQYEELFGTLPDLSDTARFPPSGKPGDMGAFDNMAPADQDAVNRVFANVGKALEGYLRQLISPHFGPSSFDRMLAGDDNAMSPAAVRGAKLFIGKAACNECHRGPMFSDYKFHNIAIPQQGDHVPTVDDGRAKGVTVLQKDVFNRGGPYSDRVDNSHLLNLTSDGLAGAFRTAPLRNVAKTAPYMHDGVFASLADVMAHYNRGGATGGFSGTKDIEIQPLLLDDSEIGDLVEFLGSLSDEAAIDPALIACPLDPCP